MFFAALQFILRIGGGRCVCCPGLFSSAIGNLQLICSLRLSARFAKSANADLSLNHKRVAALKADFFPCERFDALTPRPQRARKRKSLFAKNDSRLCQIVWRKLHRNFIAGHDPDEMLAHFTRNMRKHIALAGKIDAEHGPGKTCVTVPSVTICSSFAIARRIYAPAHVAQDHGIRDASTPARESHAQKIIRVTI